MALPPLFYPKWWRTPQRGAVTFDPPNYQQLIPAGVVAPPPGTQYTLRPLRLFGSAVGFSFPNLVAQLAPAPTTPVGASSTLLPSGWATARQGVAFALPNWQQVNSTPIITAPIGQQYTLRPTVGTRFFDYFNGQNALLRTAVPVALPIGAQLLARPALLPTQPAAFLFPSYTPTTTPVVLPLGQVYSDKPQVWDLQRSAVTFYPPRFPLAVAAGVTLRAGSFLRYRRINPP